MRRWYLVAYDIRNDKRLRKVARILEGFGTRLQYSVFRCRLTERTLERLRWELSKTVLDDDEILYIGLCEHCVRGIRKRNSDMEWPDEPPKWEII